MSILSPQDHLDPRNPLYYAPRWMREKSMRSPTPLVSSTEPASARLRRLASRAPAYDALLEKAVAESLGHPLDPEVIVEPAEITHDRDRRSALLGNTGRFAAAVGVSAIVALFIALMIPSAQDHSQQPEVVTSSSAGFVQSIKAALYPEPQKTDASEAAPAEFQTILATTSANQPAVTHEQSETLFQQFLQWQPKPAPIPAR